MSGLGSNAVRMQGFASLSCVALFLFLAAFPMLGQDHGQRKIRSQVAPIYPELARRMSINGVVRLKVTVAPNGTAKDVKVVGGHPVLVNAAMDAVKKWKFESADAESIETVQVTFVPQD